MRDSAKPRLARRAISLCAVVVGAAVLAPQATAALPPVGDGSGGFGLTPIGSFNEPVEIVDAPGKKNKKLLFVAEQAGRIVVLRNGVPQALPFLDISSQVMNGGEEGLLSIAFHPRYERTGASTSTSRTWPATTRWSSSSGRSAPAWSPIRAPRAR